jgi:hypothetical protein
MNKIRTAQGYLARAASIVLILCAAGFTLSAAKMNAGAPAEWPTHVPYDAAIHAFDAALTKAVREPAFRARLTESPDSAKKAVEEVGNINVPSDRLIVFYEPQGAPPVDTHAALAANAAAFNWSSRSNENIHVFVLPPKDADKTKEYRYEDYMMCCYPVWHRSTP